MKKNKNQVILQNILVSAPNKEVEEMYYREKSGQLSFDTYFNSFSIEKWIKYTNLDNLYLSLSLSGSGKIALLHHELVGQEIKETVLAEHNIDTQGCLETFVFHFNIENQKGFYSFKIETQKEKIEIKRGFYYTLIKEEYMKPVKVALIICTYNREAYVYRNMNILRDAFMSDATPSLLKECIEVFIVDNAGTLDYTKIDYPWIRVFHNKNTGGAGGFTRGMIEAIKCKNQGFTHVLLCDDDISIVPESIFRTLSILSIRKMEYEETFVGGAMHRMDQPWIQVESGALWDKWKISVRKLGLNLKNIKDCLINEQEEVCNYTGWWYCVMPISIIRKDNLPIPIFIHYDDIEYGIRNMRNLILLNGICVCHEPFEKNQGTPISYYYEIRNRLIMDSVCDMTISRNKMWLYFSRWFFREVFILRYKNAWLFIKSLRDFLKGVDWLLQTDPTQLHQSIMQQKYQLQDLSEIDIPFDEKKYLKGEEEKKKKRSNKLRILILNGRLQRANRVAVASTFMPPLSAFYRAKEALNYDSSSGKGYKTVYDAKEEKRLIKAYIECRKEVNKKYYEVIQDYKKRKNEITNLDFWEKYLEIQKCR